MELFATKCFLSSYIASSPMLMCIPLYQSVNLRQCSPFTGVTEAASKRGGHHTR